MRTKIQNQFDLKCVIFSAQNKIKEDTIVNADVIFHTHSDLEQIASLMNLNKLSSIIHFIREPRKLAISAYKYHLRGSEKWLTIPHNKFDGRSYTEHLNELDEIEGLLFELNNISKKAIEDMISIEENVTTIPIKLEEISHDKTLKSALELASCFGFDGEKLLTILNLICSCSLWYGNNLSDPHVTSGCGDHLDDRWKPIHEEKYHALFGERDKILRYT